MQTSAINLSALKETVYVGRVDRDFGDEESYIAHKLKSADIVLRFTTSREVAYLSC